MTDAAVSTAPPAGAPSRGGAAADTRWYALEVTEVASRLGVDPAAGLTAAEAASRRQTYGPNALPKEKPPSPVVRFLAEYKSFLQIILLVAAVVSFLTAQIAMGVLLVVLTLINAIIGMIEEGKAASALDSLQQMVSEQVRVRRDGAVAPVDAADLVPGDVVLLASGDLVPADGRVIRADALQADESSLTGESTPAGKQVDPPARAGDAVLATGDQVDMLFKNTDVTHGTGEMIVTGTGVHTAVGDVAAMLTGTKETETPLTRQLNRMTVWIAIAAAVTMIVLFVAGWLRKEPFDQIFDTAIALALAAVPEALPTVVTVILSLGSVALAKRQAVVKSLSSVETLGEVSAINSDKTGTLTMNQMTVTEVVSGPDRFTVSGTGYSTDGKVLRESGKADTVDELITPFLLANDGRLKDGGVVGDPLDGALLVLAHKAGIDPDSTRAGVTRLATLPFDPTYKLQAVFTRPKDDSTADVLVSVKGAPEALMQRAATVRSGSGAAPFDDAARQAADADVTRLESEGLRVLVAGTKTLPSQGFDPSGDLLALLDGLELTAMAGMIDPPRPSSKAAVQQAQQAHIQVRMVTGDDVVTGAAVAQQLGIPGRAITGQELSAMSDEEALAQIDGIGVIGRVAPADKQRLVDIMQRKGYVVAATGDGVNDAPALKAADIGVAMGSGTDVAKNSGRMVLEDDNFATIIYAVEQGRKLYDNLSKYVSFILITLVTFVLTFLVATLFDIANGQPFSAAQILWINFLIDTPLGVALGFDSETAGLMTRRPLARGANIITGAMLVTVGLVSVAMTVGVLSLIRYGEQSLGSLTVAGTLALTAFGFFRIVCAWESRSSRDSALTLDTFRNVQLDLLIVGVVVVMVLATEWDVLQRLLGTTHLDGGQWLLCLGGAVVLMILWEVGKLIARLRARTAEPPAPAPKPASAPAAPQA